MSPWAMYTLDVLAIVGTIIFIQIVLNWAESNGAPHDGDNGDSA